MSNTKTPKKNGGKTPKMPRMIPASFPTHLNTRRRTSKGSKK